MHQTPQDKPRLRRVFVAGKLARRRPCCTDQAHFGPFFPRPDIREWLIGAGIEDVPVQVDCARCGSTIALPAGRTVEA